MDEYVVYDTYSDYVNAFNDVIKPYYDEVFLEIVDRLEVIEYGFGLVVGVCLMIIFFVVFKEVFN